MVEKLFGTDGVRGVANVFPMVPEFALKLAQAAAASICQKHKRAAIAKDTRISGDMLEAALIAGFPLRGLRLSVWAFCRRRQLRCWHRSLRWIWR